MADWKGRLGVLYSTNPDYQYEIESEAEAELLAPAAQRLRVMLDRRNRGGKEVTVVTGFVGPDENLKTLGKQLKQRCGVGGSTKDGEILIQGDKRDQILRLLLDMGYKQTKRQG